MDKNLPASAGVPGVSRAVEQVSPWARAAEPKLRSPTPYSERRHHREKPALHSGGYALLTAARESLSIATKTQRSKKERKKFNVKNVRI